MKLSRVLRQGIAALICLFALVPTALAQTEGRFVGAVLDPSGSAVTAATVVVRNEKTAEERTVTSNAQGRYLVPNLKPSVYSIKVTVPNFAPLEYTGMALQAAQEFALDLQLQPAGVTESVTVHADVATVDLSSARLGVNVGERDVQNLPVNGRQMSQLMLQAPGSSDHQHARRRQLAQHPTSGSHSRRGPVHQPGRRPVPEPGRIRDAGAGHVR